MNEKIDLIALTQKMKDDATGYARWMNDRYSEGDVERNHVSYGRMKQALRVLQLLGHQAEDATWGQANLLICEKITVDGEVVYRR